MRESYHLVTALCACYPQPPTDICWRPRATSQCPSQDATVDLKVVGYALKYFSQCGEDLLRIHHGGVPKGTSLLFLPRCDGPSQHIHFENLVRHHDSFSLFGLHVQPRPRPPLDKGNTEGRPVDCLDHCIVDPVNHLHNSQHIPMHICVFLANGLPWRF